MRWKKPFAKEYRRSTGIASLLLCLAAAAQKPSGELPKDLLDLVQIKQKMRENLTHLPDFTCLETMERSRKAGNTTAFTLADNVRLDVLYTGNRELYAWPGSRKFDDMDPRMSGIGLVSSGEFASHAHTVFAANTAQIHFVGAESWHGQDALKYSFRVPAMVSGWTLNIGGVTGIVGERGAFWADPKTFEVLRLEIFADEIPPAMPLQSAELGIEYGRIRIGSADVLAPQHADLLITHDDHSQSRNLVEFSQCRQYHAESAIRFDTEAVPASDTAGVQDVELPADLPLKLQLDAAFDSDSAAQGDLITAHLMAPAELKGQVYIPQGALVRGRIRRLERYPIAQPYLVIGIEFSEIEFGNKRAAFLGHLDQMDPIRGQVPTNQPSSRGPADLSAPMKPGNFPAGGGIYPTGPPSPNSTMVEKIRIVDLTGLELPGVGTFAVDGQRVKLAAGFRMTWRTVSLAPAPAAPARKK
jgi:hypothetical protein